MLSALGVFVNNLETRGLGCAWWRWTTNTMYMACGVQDYDENDPDGDTETYPVNVIEQHPLIDCGGRGTGGAGGGGGGDEETERTTLLGQSMLGASRPGKLL